MNFIRFALLPFLLLTPACSTLVLEPADFSWPIESVLRVNNDGYVSDERYSFSLNTKNLFFEETGDSLAYLDRDLRIIRDREGYYYITSNNFKNVYVFTNNKGEFRLGKKIQITETGINKPAFNQRSPYIELLNGETKFLLSSDGIKE